MIPSFLQYASGVAALVAAYFWFAAARTPAPPMTWTGIKELKPWLDQSAKNNRRGAAAAAVAALLTAITTIWPLLPN